MIVFRLSCAHDHDFEGWFASAEDYDRQSRAGEVSCPMCDSRVVTKLPSAPYVNTGASVAAVAPPGPSRQPAADGLRKLKALLIENTEDVGRRFPEIARRMHYGEEDSRGIRGQVSSEEAVDLHEEGIAVLMLPTGMILGDEVH